MEILRRLLFLPKIKENGDWQLSPKCCMEDFARTVPSFHSVIGGMKFSIALRSLGWQMTKWIAGAFPLDTMTH